MSQKNKKKTINGQAITVYELSVRQIREIIEDLDNLDNQKVLDILSLCSDVTLAQIEDMAPSDIRQLWDAWSEVNADFLHLINAAMRRPPVQKLVDDFLSAILTDVFAALPSAGTPIAGSTGGASSGPASITPTNPTGTKSDIASSG